MSEASEAAKRLEVSEAVAVSGASGAAPQKVDISEAAVIPQKAVKSESIVMLEASVVSSEASVLSSEASAQSSEASVLSSEASVLLSEEFVLSHEASVSLGT